MMSVRVSVIIPTCRENDESYLLKMAEHYPSHSQLEFLVADFDTPKELLEQIKRSDFNILQTNLQTRAERLQKGLEEAHGELIVLHHPRSLLDPSAWHQLLEPQEPLTWGGFTHRFDQQSWGLNFTSWYSNHVRPCLWRVVYLDHCLYFKKKLLTSPIPPVPIFEDTEISRVLRCSGPPKILAPPAVTSAVRFRKNGFWQQVCKNQILKVAYHLGVSRDRMNKFYEKKLNLN
jgi:hypothetical protein